MTETSPPPTEQHPADVPLYSWVDAARYLHLPWWAAAVLRSGHFPPFPHPDWARGFPFRGGPWPEAFDGGPPDLGFRRVAELFVRSAALRLLPLDPPETWAEAERYAAICRAIGRVLEVTSREPVPFDGTPADDRADRLVRVADHLLDEGQSAAARKWTAAYFARIDEADGAPARLYPISRDPAEGSPRVIVLDPRRRFGRPSLAGRGIPTDILFGQFQAGDSAAELAADYDLTVPEVEEAIRFEGLVPAAGHPCVW